ncbi:hypothetical protein [Terasakiella sp. SH-1]|uniref:hypothetical protein n=1 Tax=Terasakiella sp. SH-1 TaxID=2560057 RepID=UPI001073638B|nr:hypothetical protein [Terasakiella sp. SH-1]
MPLLYIVLVLQLPLGQNLLADGSQAYLDFSPEHSLGYPFFLKIIRFFSTAPLIVAYVQLGLFALALLHLSVTLFRVTASHFLGVSVALLVALNPFVLEYHFRLSTDSLFVTTSLLTLSFLLSCFRRARFLNLSGFGAMIGIGLSLQPYGLAHVLLLFIAAPLNRKKNYCSFPKALLIPLTLCLAIVGIEVVAYNALHENHEFRPATAKIYANTILMETQQSTPYAPKDPRTAIWHKIEHDLAPVRTEIWQTAASKDRQQLLGQHIEESGQDFAVNAMTQAAFLLGKSVDDIRMDIASARIVQDPLAFLFITVEHYRSIWVEPFALHYAVLLLTAATSFIGLWMWVKGAAFNAPCAIAVYGALMIQGHALIYAHSGLGHGTLITLFSPVITLIILGLVLGFYFCFINPLRRET